jgi:hypothetical protein
MVMHRSGSTSRNGAGEAGCTREAPQSPRAAQVEPCLVRHRGRAGSVPGASEEDQHRLDRRSHVGSPRGIDTAAVRAGSGLKFVPEQPGAELPADCPGDVDGVSGYGLPTAAVAIERYVQAESARCMLRDAVQFGQPGR